MAHKDLRKLVREMEKQGWTVEHMNSDHLRWYPPDGRDPVFSGSTPSDWRALRNIKAKLRRRGADI